MSSKKCFVKHLSWNNHLVKLKQLLVFCATIRSETELRYYLAQGKHIQRKQDGT